MAKSKVNLVDEGFHVSLVETAFFDGKFEIPHMTISDRSTAYDRRGKLYAESVDVSWKKYLDDEHYHISTLDELPNMISDIVKAHANSNTQNANSESFNEISW